MDMATLYARMKVEATQDVLERAGIREYEIVPDTEVDSSPPRFYINIKSEKDRFLYNLRGDAYFQREIAKEMREQMMTNADVINELLSKIK